MKEMEKPTPTQVSETSDTLRSAQSVIDSHSPVDAEELDLAYATVRSCREQLEQWGVWS